MTPIIWMHVNLLILDIEMFSCAHSVISTASKCELQWDSHVLLCTATQRCPSIDICFILKWCLLLLFNRKSATSAQCCRCLTENPGCAEDATEENQTRVGACWSCQVFNIETQTFIHLFPFAPLCAPKSSSTRYSSSSLLLSRSCLDAGVGGVARRQISSILSRSRM